MGSGVEEEGRWRRAEEVKVRRADEEVGGGVCGRG